MGKGAVLLPIHNLHRSFNLVFGHTKDGTTKTPILGGIGCWHFCYHGGCSTRGFEECGWHGVYVEGGSNGETKEKVLGGGKRRHGGVPVGRI